MRYEVVVTALILAAAIITICMINRPDYEPEPEPIAVKYMTGIGEADPMFRLFGNGSMVVWSGPACPEPMIVGEMCFSDDADKMYVGVGSMRMPISTESLVEYWEKYHR